MTVLAFADIFKGRLNHNKMLQGFRIFIESFTEKYIEGFVLMRLFGKLEQNMVQCPFME